MSGAVIIQQTNGEQIDLSAMIQSAVTSAIVDVEQQKKVQSKHGRSDRGNGSEKLGSILREYRENRMLSQSELARRAKVHPTTINKIEDGERGMSMQTLARLSPFLSIFFTLSVLEQYTGLPEGHGWADAEGTTTDSADTRGEAGGPEPEHPVPEQRGPATSAKGSHGTYHGVGDEGSP